MYKCNKTSTISRLILSRFLNPRTQGNCPGSAHGILECLTSRITVTLLPLTFSVHMKCYAILYKHVTVHIKKQSFYGIYLNIIQQPSFLSRNLYEFSRGERQILASSMIASRLSQRVQALSCIQNYRTASSTDSRSIC